MTDLPVDTDVITDFVFVSDEPRPIDALIALGSSWIELLEKALDVITKVSPGVVVLSGRYGEKSGRVMAEHLPERYQGDYETEADMMYSVLVEWGVDGSRMLLERESRNTRENIENSLAMLEERVPDMATETRRVTIGICCQAFHARRALETAKSIADEMGLGFGSVEFAVFPADTQGISRENWYETKHGRKKVLDEMRKLREYLGIEMEISKTFESNIID